LVFWRVSFGNLSRFGGGLLGIRVGLDYYPYIGKYTVYQVYFVFGECGYILGFVVCLLLVD